MSWDPGVYLKFDSERTRPALDLLSRVPLAAPAHVIDLGCGPGNSTALLLARWSGASVTGLDSSDDMIARARAAIPNATFAVADFECWTPDAPPDLIYSNAALHWSRDPVRLAVRLAGLLAPEGVLAFQIPQNFDQPTHTIPHALADAYGVSAARWYDPATFPKAAEFARAFPAADIWTTEYLHRLRGVDPVYEWVSGSALRPFLAALEPSQREAFASEVKASYRAAYPTDSEGIVHFPFRRLFVVSRRIDARS